MNLIDFSTHDSPKESCYSEGQYLEALSKGELEAFEILYDRYGKELFSYVYKIVLDEEDAKDIVQDFFYSILTSKKIIQVNSSVKAYLFTSIRNRALNFLRDHARHLKLAQSFSNFEESEFYQHNFSSHLIELKELNQRISSEINQLPETLKKVFKLSREDGLTNLEIAENTGLSHKTVRNRVSLALKILRNRMSDLLIYPILYLFLK